MTAAELPARAMAGAPCILRYRAVVKRFGAFTALSGVDLDVHAGEVVCLIGPSGSGKSTLLRCTNGLETLDGGDIEFEGAQLPREERTLRAVRRRMGMVFQSFELFPHFTARQNVAEGPRTVLGMSQTDAGARADALLAKVGLADKAGNFPSALSGGQQQRVAIARALVNNPRIIMADEPTGALDTATGEEIMQIFATLNRAQGMTIILVTHEPTIAAHARRTIHVRDGLIVADERRAPAISV